MGSFSISPSGPHGCVRCQCKQIEELRMGHLFDVCRRSSPRNDRFQSTFAKVICNRCMLLDSLVPNHIQEVFFFFLNNICYLVSEPGTHLTKNILSVHHLLTPCCAACPPLLLHFEPAAQEVKHCLTSSHRK